MELSRNDTSIIRPDEEKRVGSRAVLGILHPSSHPPNDCFYSCGSDLSLRTLPPPYVIQLKKTFDPEAWENREPSDLCLLRLDRFQSPACRHDCCVTDNMIVIEEYEKPFKELFPEPRTKFPNTHRCLLHFHRTLHLKTIHLIPQQNMFHEGEDIAIVPTEEDTVMWCPAVARYTIFLNKIDALRHRESRFVPAIVGGAYIGTLCSEVATQLIAKRRCSKDGLSILFHNKMDEFLASIKEESILREQLEEEYQKLDASELYV